MILNGKMINAGELRKYAYPWGTDIAVGRPLFAMVNPQHSIELMSTP